MCFMPIFPLLPKVNKHFAEFLGVHRGAYSRPSFESVIARLTIKSEKEAGPRGAQGYTRVNIPFGRAPGHLMNTFGKATALSSNCKEMLPENWKRAKKPPLKLMTTQP